MFRVSDLQDSRNLASISVTSGLPWSAFDGGSSIPTQRVHTAVVPKHLVDNVGTFTIACFLYYDRRVQPHPSVARISIPRCESMPQKTVSDFVASEAKSCLTSECVISTVQLAELTPNMYHCILIIPQLGGSEAQCGSLDAL